jgi:hypothetical protein
MGLLKSSRVHSISGLTSTVHVWSVMTLASRPYAYSKQLIEVSESLVYLHAQKVVHGHLNDVCISPLSITSISHITIVDLGKHLH